MYIGPIGVARSSAQDDTRGRRRDAKWKEKLLVFLGPSSKIMKMCTYFFLKKKKKNRMFRPWKAYCWCTQVVLFIYPLLFSFPFDWHPIFMRYVSTLEYGIRGAFSLRPLSALMFLKRQQTFPNAGSWRYHRQRVALVRKNIHYWFTVRPAVASVSLGLFRSFFYFGKFWPPDVFVPGDGKK